jgi:hypothetical protein
MSMRPPLVGVVIACLLGGALSAQQAPRRGSSRTAWGDPDLQGTWDYWTFTPLERPADLPPGAVLTAEQAAQLAERLKRQALQGDETVRPGDPGAYSQEVWTDRTKATALTQPSLIVDPPDGKIPPLTAAAARRVPGEPVRIRTGGRGTDGPEERGVAERCILGFSTGPPMLPAGYNNNIQIVQTRTWVAILLEMNHDLRVIPLDGRPHLNGGVRQWMGDPRGRWQGNTLVVETTNFTNKTASISLTGLALGSAEQLRLTERFTRVAPDRLTYEFTIDDPGSFIRPFTGRFDMNRTDALVYEYACHEGNYALGNILRAARMQEIGKR